MKNFEVLTEEQINEIHFKALDILWNTGVEVFSEEACKIFEKNGAWVNGKRVKIPPYLVEEAIKKAPKCFTLHARNGSTVQMESKGNAVYFEPMIGRMYFLDPDTEERRKTTLEDLGKLIKIADYLDNYKLLHSGSIMPAIAGVDDSLAHVLGYLNGVKNSSKVIKGSVRGKQVAKDCINMASIVAQKDKDELWKEPNIFTTCNVVSPLKLDKKMTEGLMEYAKCGLPVDITSEPQCGASSPITIAGTIAQQTAEILSGVTIAQLVNPGTPVWMGTCGAAMDMREGVIALGGIEGALINVAHAQMTRFYEIPSRGTGSNTESKILDMQAGIEKAITLFLTSLAGNNMIFYPGTLEHALTISMESLVVDHDICTMALRALKGIEFNNETLANDLIQEVGPGGNYMGTDHTLKYFKETLMPPFSNRQNRKDWENNGRKTTYQLAKEKVKEILAEHKVEELPEKIETELKEYIEEVKKREKIEGDKNEQ